MGRSLYPDPQWDKLAQLWEEFYPPSRLDDTRRRLLGILEATIPSFVEVLVHHRPIALNGHSLKEVLPVVERQPAELRKHWQAWQASPIVRRRTSPSLAFAVLGQAKVDGQLPSEREGTLVSEMLTRWAVSNSISSLASCLSQRVELVN